VTFRDGVAEMPIAQSAIHNDVAAIG